MGDCQNHGPFLGPYYNTGPNTGPNLGDSKREWSFWDPEGGLGRAWGSVRRGMLTLASAT